MTVPRRVRTIGLLLIVVWIVAAFVLPHPVNPASSPETRIDRHAQAPDDIAALLRRSCFDCHSSETDWPWYTNLAPASLFLRHHVREGRAALNMSAWAEYSTFEQADLLDEMCEEVREGHMPVAPYLWLHREAVVSQAQVEALCAWTAREAERVMGVAP